MNFPYKKRKKHRFYCKFFHPKDNTKNSAELKNCITLCISSLPLGEELDGVLISLSFTAKQGIQTNKQVQ
jgi:hypothetical protein